MKYIEGNWCLKGEEWMRVHFKLHLIVKSLTDSQITDPLDGATFFDTKN